MKDVSAPMRMRVNTGPGNRCEGVMNEPEPRRLVILGATGSIGQSTAEVIAATPGRFEVEVVAAGSDALRLAKMARRLSARCAVISDTDQYLALKNALAGSGIEVAAGDDAVVAAATRPADLVIGAITGAAGVLSAYAAVEQGRTIALANKECLVCAGAPFMAGAKKNGAQLLPMDSEHNAIFQALAGRLDADIDRMILTASGGPFRTWSKAEIEAATPEQALAHPNWDMGPKVTIDSATLMNKGLELIEAFYLFGVAANQLDVLVHPQSIVHGLVSYSDGSTVAGMANPDMRVPIAHCLGWPERLATGVPQLDLADIANLTFEKPDFDRFPALSLAMNALKQGGAMPTVLNAANEVAVDCFLGKRIGFSDIARLVDEVCSKYAQNNPLRAPATIAEAMLVDHNAREIARASWPGGQLLS